ncbi:MAG: type II toxin-antitoxin system VapC family toxin [Pyrinomonadaceae bacterium]
MRFLIDTHVLIWHFEDDAQLTLERSAFIDDPDNEPLVSFASLWEIAIKQSLDKLKLSSSLDNIVGAIEESTTSLLPIDSRHLIRVAELQFHRKDPFDRLIIAQALAENIPIITSDPHFAAYGVALL